MHDRLEQLVRTVHKSCEYRGKKRKQQQYEVENGSSIRDACLEGHRKRWRLVQEWADLPPFPSTSPDKLPLNSSLDKPKATPSRSTDITHMSGAGDDNRQYTHLTKTLPSVKSLGDLYTMLDASVKYAYSVGDPIVGAFHEEEQQQKRMEEEKESREDEDRTELLITLLQLRAAARNFRRAIKAERAFKEVMRGLGVTYVP